MEKIGAWIRNPRNNFMKGQTKRAGLYELFCEKPQSCDLLRRENSCLHCGAMSPCRFGRKSAVEGPTQKARSFHSILDGWRKRNEGFIGRLKPLTAYNRIFKANGHFYLPYSFMTKDFLGPENAPLETKWVAEEDMTTALLRDLCTAAPRALFGGVIRDYQEKEVPKFIADLHSFYPEIFALLPDDQKARLATISYVGRKADITTCAPGRYVFARSTWEWDGEILHGRNMLFQPVKGEIAITIKPKPGESVVITSNEQVTGETRFLD